MTPTQSAAALRAAVAAFVERVESVDEQLTRRPSRPGAWCARQILGHLIDSACNNHRRFIVGQSNEIKQFDGYEQDAWVARQRYDEVAWRDLLPLWASYNQHLAHVMTSTPDDAASRTATSPDGSSEVSVAFLMSDYVRHLEHHLAQIRTLLAV